VKHLPAIGFLCLIMIFQAQLAAQSIIKSDTEKLQLVYLGKRYTYLTPHILRSYFNALNFHEELWSYDSGKVYVMLNDFQDYGNGGAITMPFNQIFIGIGSYNFAFSIIPSSEHFQWLFNHELVHVVMTDKANSQDQFWRKLFLGKVRRDEKYPVSALWSYATVPRWYAPRWYQEGIACFMETWMSGGLGRAMGYYDEMYFRSIVNENATIHSVIGIETEGTALDFQVDANSYLYGTRFVTWLANEYGIENLKDFYLRSENSKAFFGSQFKKVYEQPLGSAWRKWTDDEIDFQHGNIQKIKEFPLTTFQPITRHALGNMSTYRYNPKTKKIYAAVNYPGVISQIAEIDTKTGNMRKIAVLDSPSLYYTTYLAYDADSNHIFISEQNYKYRNLVSIDAATGKKSRLIKFSRTGDLVFNSIDRSIWRVKLDNGYSTLVKIPPPYFEIISLFTAPFGQAIFDLDISQDGQLLSASLSGIRGEQELVVFNINELEHGSQRYQSLLIFEDNTLNQFKFSHDGQSLIGTSYYNGVSNIWRLGLEDKYLELMSNTETGFFMPLHYHPDSLLVLRFYRDGIKPGRIPLEVLSQVNAIEFMGNRVVTNSSEVIEWSLPQPPPVDEENVPEEAYIPVNEMVLANAWPDIAGYKNTVVAGYRVQWRDPLALSQIDVFIGTSPWSQYQDKQKIHAHFEWSYWNWKLLASWNKVDFYDFFGPTKRGRAGYTVGITHERSYMLREPLKWSYNFGVYKYGNLEVLPKHQNVVSPIRSLQAVKIGYNLSKLRRTLRGIENERGYSWSVSATTFYAESEFFPSFSSIQNAGFLIPDIRNTSFWIRNSIGQSFGTSESALSYFYLGGFRNNYIDWQDAKQYRSKLSFPGAEIDEIKVYSFVRTMAELNLKPLRTRNFGTTWLYPTLIQTSIFGSNLLTDLAENHSSLA
jgi:WD40 repeat protein